MIRATLRKKELPLGTAPVHKLVLSFMLTALAGLLLNTVYSLTDALFVAHAVGDDAMGGISAVYPFVILQSALATAVGSGAAVLVALRLGEGDKKGAGSATLSAMTVFYAVSGAGTIVGFCVLDKLLAAMGATGVLYEHAKDYFIVILAGNVFSTGFSSVIRAEGGNLYSLLIWVIPILLNIVLDAVFILALGLGVTGSALATVIAQMTSFSMSVFFFARLSVQNFKGARPSLAAAARVALTGLPALIQTGGLSVMIALVNSRLAENPSALTAFGYASRLLTYAIIPVTAAAQALPPVLGYNFGAGLGRRAARSVSAAFALAMAGAAFMLILAEAAAEPLIGIFTRDKELVEAGADCLRVIAAALPLVPAALIPGAALQATGRKSAATLLYAAAPVSFLVFFALFGLLPENSSVLWASPAAYAFSALASAAVFAVRGRSLFLCALPYARQE